MKNSVKKLLIALLALAITVAASAQQQDSLEYRIQQDFQKFNKQHTTGTVLMLSGVAVTSIGVLSINPLLPQSNGFGTGLLVFGTLMTSVGAIVQIDSYKFLGGKRSLTIYPNGIKLTF